MSKRRFRKIQQPPGTKIDFDNILISKTGGIWASSKNDGLVYYDGTEMKVYRHSRTDTNTIAAGWIYDMAEDPEGNLYVAVYDGGLNIINKKRNSIEKINFKDSIQEPKSALLMSICADEQHNVLMGLLGRGLFIYNTINKSIRHFNLDPAKPDNWFLPIGNTINRIKQDPSDNNIFWIMSNKGGLYNYDRRKSEFRAVYAAPDTARRMTRAFSLFVNKNGDVFFGSGNNSINSSSINIFSKKNGDIKFGTEMVTHTEFRPTSRLTSRGFFYNKSDSEFYHFFSPTEVVTYTPVSDTYRSYKLPFIGLQDLSHVSLITNDERNNIWLIADGELYYSSPQYTLFKTFDYERLWSKDISFLDRGPRLLDMTWDAIGQVYAVLFSNADSVLFLNKDLKSIKSARLISSAQKKTYWPTLIFDSKSRLWILKDTLSIWDPSKSMCMSYNEYFGKPFPLAKEMITDMQKGTDDIIYFFTNLKNVYAFNINNAELKLLGNINIKSESYPSHMYGFDSLFNKLLFMIPTSSFVFDIRTGKTSQIGPGTFGDSSVSATGKGSFDSEGNYWIGASNGFIYELDNSFKLKDSISTFQSIAARGFFIRRIGRDSLLIENGEQLLIFHTKKKIYNLVNSDNGIIKRSEMSTKRFYFVNNNFFLSVDNKLQYTRFEDLPKLPPPAAVIVDIKLRNKSYKIPVEDSTTLHFTYWENDLSFIISALEMDFPERIQYAYRLKKFNNDWRFTDISNRNIVYTNLPSGKYELEIKAQFRGQEWGPVMSLVIIITPPFWQTWWFRILAILAVIGSVFYFIKRQISRVRRKEKEKALHEKELLELEAKALRAQMNPHFIFNCLNSIKSLMQENEIDKGVTYLTTFSKLIRTLFNNADKKEISLYDEIETCKLYLQLEAMRFDSKFSYNVNIDETIDLKSISVPALIIQPFIENAIWHGIVPKANGGTVSLTVNKSNGSIEIIVDDDGIGRESSQQNKAASIGHQSKGVNLTQSRLELDNLLQQRKAKLETIDKTDENGKARGTRVIITLPQEE